ncbi:hypothetical protein FEM48_Zijuj01G0282500 [Ziziphus jujuba var. spinosa]|uniref:Protein kinase domain-containing protein n=1 Tax=Ziziphus jujuba var. spinosa TaxID=714518 RepID=A0A978W5F1_ZIZJJ|nr:hypothetical protein FEM48_Zijuj01G0282500 [Ziziphus jujuba var. spinosa]
MSREQKRVKQEKGSDVAEKVVVAVKASKEIPKTALVWALTHVVQPGDCITLLVVVPAQIYERLFNLRASSTVILLGKDRVHLFIKSLEGRRLWGFPLFAGDCASGHRKSNSGTTSELKCDITDSCSQMILQLHDVYDPNKINVKIKIISGSPCGAVAAEAKRAQASWVILDKQLKHEEKRCMEELQCNIVVMKRSQPKVLRLNLNGSPKKEPELACQLPPEHEKGSEKHPNKKDDSLNSIRGPVVTPTSSPELGTPFTATEAGASSVSSSDPGTSPFLISEINGDLKKEGSIAAKENQDIDDASSDSDCENLSMSSASLRFQPWVADFLNSHRHASQHIEESSHKSNYKPQPSSTNSLEKFTKHDREAGVGMPNYRSDIDFSGNVREAISLSRNAPPGPPPLCSICQHKAPVFGKPPKWFSYAELELATGGFSQANFLAEGGFGSVHRGVLPDGQAVAVKQHKLASSQGDLEFCSEVEVLSCAQHRNVVMLIGFCIEDRRRLLVYEYICNGSLDSHLYGQRRQPLEWSARQKIAVGAARGLRYLHEECRVGCIVHRDMRPNNILITHDFEPLVGDFGLARWQPDGDTGVETRARPLLEEYAIDELVDPRLGNQYSEQEVYCMLHAASLCIRRDPQSRPRMSQVLRILEGDLVMDTNCVSTPGYDVGNRSGRLWAEQQQHQQCHVPLADEALGDFSGKLNLENLRSTYWERDKARRTSCEDDL